MITPRDRVSAVLARDERLVDVFTSLSPIFERLRSPTMRKVMARLVTVEQAARMAGLEPELLVERLNQRLAAAAGAEGAGIEMNTEPWTTGETPGRVGERAEMTTETRPDGIPAALAQVPDESIVDIDVRPDLRRGEEPFSKIMAARREVPPGGILRLRATFEPVPLYAVLGKQGMRHWTERFADDDWRVWFYTAPDTISVADTPAPTELETTTAPGTAAPPAAPTADPEDDVVILDVRGLEPPDPMLRTFEALAELPQGKTLLQLNVRVPQFLLPQLAERGFTYEIREQSRDLVRIFIRHAASAE